MLKPKNILRAARLGHFWVSLLAMGTFLMFFAMVVTADASWPIKIFGLLLSFLLPYMFLYVAYNDFDLARVMLEEIGATRWYSTVTIGSRKIYYDVENIVVEGPEGSIRIKCGDRIPDRYIIELSQIVLAERREKKQKEALRRQRIEGKLKQIEKEDDLGF